MFAAASSGLSAATPASRTRISAERPFSMAAAIGPMNGASPRISSSGFNPAQMKCSQVR